MPIPIGLREFYKEQGMDFPDGPVVVKLLKSLYGLRQASFCFNQVLVASLKQLGFKETTEPCIFVRYEAESDSYSTVSVYVDDLVICFTDADVMAEFKKKLAETNELFTVEDRGQVRHLLGVKVDYDRENGRFALSQEAYLEKLYERFRLNEIDRQLVPMKKEDAMMFAKPAKWEIEQLKQGKTINNDRCDATTFKAVVGSALHAIKWTRLDAMTAVIDRWSRTPWTNRSLMAKRSKKRRIRAILARNPRRTGPQKSRIPWKPI